MWTGTVRPLNTHLIWKFIHWRAHLRFLLCKTIALPLECIRTVGTSCCSDRWLHVQPCIGRLRCVRAPWKHVSVRTRVGELLCWRAPVLEFVVHCLHSRWPTWSATEQQYHTKNRLDFRQCFVYSRYIGYVTPNLRSRYTQSTCCRMRNPVLGKHGGHPQQREQK